MDFALYILGIILIIVGCVGAGEKTMLQAKWYWQLIAGIGILLAFYNIVRLGKKEELEKDEKHGGE